MRVCRCGHARLGLVASSGVVQGATGLGAANRLADAKRTPVARIVLPVLDPMMPPSRVEIVIVALGVLLMRRTYSPAVNGLDIASSGWRGIVIAPVGSKAT